MGCEAIDVTGAKYLIKLESKDFYVGKKSYHNLQIDEYKTLYIK